MIERTFGKSYAGSAPENYERFFVPAIGAPLAAALVDVAAPQPGERVLDVACGTGVVARLVAERVGSTGAVAGLDANPDAGEIRASMTEAGFQEVRVEAAAATLPLPADFVWQYIQSTPLAGVIGQVGDKQRDALERDVGAEWRGAEVDGGLSLAVRVTTVTARA